MAETTEEESATFTGEWFDKVKTSWNKETAKVGAGYKNLPDGIYITKLASVKVGPNKNTDPMVTWSYHIESGEFEGEAQLDFDVLSREGGIQRLGDKMALYGVDIRALSGPAELPEALNSILDDEPIVRLRLKTNRGKDGKDYQNIYINKVEARGVSADEKSENTFNLVAGISVRFRHEGNKVSGKVLSISDETETAQIDLPDGAGELTVPYSNILGLAE